MGAFVQGETITRQRPQASVDQYSEEPAPDWTKPPAAVEIDGWGVDDSRSAWSVEQGREPVVSDVVLYRPEVADVLAGDRVVVRGRTYTVDGNPATWRHPMTGWSAGFVVRGNLVEG